MLRIYEHLKNKYNKLLQDADMGDPDAQAMIHDSDRLAWVMHTMNGEYDVTNTRD